MRGEELTSYTEDGFNRVLGNFLSDARRTAHLGPDEVAEKLGVTLEQLCAMEHDGAGMTAYQARRLADITGVSIAPLFENLNPRVSVHVMDFNYFINTLVHMSEIITNLSIKIDGGKSIFQAGDK